MMTKQRISRLKNKILKSRSRLLMNEPFFAILLMYMKFVAVSGVDTISTNGRCIYFSPDFIDKLHENELDYILCHQIMHIVNGHIWRNEELKGESFHHACDIIVNIQLNEFFEEKRFPHLGKIRTNIPEHPKIPFDIQPEEVYKMLIYRVGAFPDDVRKKFMFDSDFAWDKKLENGRYGTMILDFDDDRKYADLNNQKNAALTIGDGNGGGESAKANGENMAVSKSQWRSRIAAALKNSSKSSSESGKQKAGNKVELIERIVKKSHSKTVDWKRLLVDFIQENICDYSFMPPDKRYEDSPFFLPDFNEKEEMVKDILFMVDASASISDEMLAAAYSQIKGCCDMFSGKLSGYVGFFDFDVSDIVPFSDWNDIEEIVPLGWGGTSFSAVFESIAEQMEGKNLSSIIIITDGEDKFPDEGAACGVPVLWLINNEEISPPWGRVVRFS